MKLSEIKPYPRNAKKHPRKQIEQVAASIREFGFNQPIVVDKDKVIIVGHARFEAAKLLGLDEVPVKIVDLEKKKANAYRLADNKLNESDWDMELVIEELKALEDDALVALIRFEKDLLIEPNEEDDQVPDVPEEPKSKLGDIYELGRHRVLCGDSTKREDVERLMNGKKADMVFTDPPYGVDYTGKTRDKLKIQNDIHTNIFREVLPNLILSVKSGASFYICCPPGNKFKDFFLPFEELCHLSATIIWAKNSLVLGHGDYHYQHEPILYGWASTGTHQFYGDRAQTTIWNINRPARSAEHPTMKPIELITRALTNSSKNEDYILDPFLGSGSTLIAAEKTGRICYGMEIDPRYCDVIVKRWEDYTGQQSRKVSSSEYGSPIQKRI